MISDLLCSEFAAKYLPAIIAAYKEDTATYNVSEYILNLISDVYVDTNFALMPTYFFCRPYFVRYTKSPLASGFWPLQSNTLEKAYNR